jgi:uncharacterized protein (DUF983 family)
MRKNLFDVVADAVVIDDTIKPCPSCGSGEVSVFRDGELSRIECDECGTGLHGADDYEAVAKWNRRSEA